MAATDFTPRPDQIATLAKLITTPRHIDRSEPGTGKTLPACLYTWWNHLQGKQTVWLQPLGIIGKNRKELLRFTHFKPSEVVIVGGTATQRQVQYKTHARVFLMGADMFGREWETLLAHNPNIDLLIGDEWHTMFAGNDSKRTQSLYTAMNHITRLLVMTGTLVKGRLNTAYPAISLCEPRYYGSHNAFMSFHAILDDWGKPVCWINLEKFQEILSRHSTLVTFKDVYGDAPVIFQTEYIDLGGPQRAAYMEFAAKAILELEETFLTGASPGVNLIRARQLLSSPEIFGIGKGHKTARDEALLVHLQEHEASGEPFVIFTASVPEQERIYKMCSDMGFRMGLMNGNTSTAQRVKNDEEFCARQLDGLVCSPQVAAFGYNWGFVDHFIYLHMAYGDDDFEQSYKRGTRGIRTRPLRVTLLTYEDTVEENVLGVIIKKMYIAQEVDPHKQVINLFGR